MKLATQDKKDLMHVYDTWWHSYLNGDVNTYDFFLAKDYHFIGSTNNEDFLNKKDTTKFFEDTAEQLAGKAELRNLKQTIDVIEKNLVLFTDLADAYVLSDYDWVFYSRFRFTSLLKKTKEGWRFTYQHFSAPDTKAQDGETLGTEKITKENQELRDAIKRRTIELEHKNKELEIEASLERVRAASMAMHRTNDIEQVVVVFFEQMKHLNITFLQSWITILHLDKGYFDTWFSPIDGIYNEPAHFKMASAAFEKTSIKSWKSGVPFSYLSFKTKVEVDQFLLACDELINSNYFSHAQKKLKYPRLEIVEARHKYGFISKSTLEEPTKEDEDILMRFAKVFEQTYTRFLDLQKAEAQAKEAQIEAALEKVRSRTMAMQKSEDLNKAASDMFNQIQVLGMQPWACGFNIFDKDEKAVTQFMSLADGGISPPFKTPLTEDPFFISINKARQQRNELLVMESKGESLAETYRYIFSLPGSKEVFGDLENSGFEMPKFQITHCAYFSQGYLVFITYEPVPESWDIFKRFAKVFQQTYTRFLDLQKAEAQVREAQIEAALERVRSRTMAMRHSEELQLAALLMFQQIETLGVSAFGCGFNIWDDDKKASTAWMAGKNRLQPPFKTPSSEDIFLRIYDSSEKGESLFVEEQAGENLKAHYQYMVSIPEFKGIVDEMSENGHSLPDYQIMHCAFFSHGYLMFISFETVQDAYDIFKRFAKVFEQTYTRFLDLQKAEGQSREVQIELALERVRARTMAMQHSNELQEASQLLDNQVRALGIETWGCAFNIYGENESFEWFSTQAGTMQPYKTPRINIFKKYFDIGQKGESLFIQNFEGDDCIAHYEFLSSLPEAGVGLRKIKESGGSFPTFQIDHVAYFKQGYLLFITFEEVPEAHDIFKRFSRVFEQTYTRFLDLQKAEAQTRESRINLAVERVRAKALAMHKSEEIMDVVAKLKDEVMNLDIPDVIAATIFLKEGENKVRMWDLSSLEKDNDGYQIPFDITFKLKKRDPHLYVKRVWENPKNYFLELQQAKDFKRIIAWLRENHKTEVANEVEEFIESTKLKQLHHAVKKLNNGKLVIDSLNPPPDEMETILTKMGAAFDLAYKRFEDLQKSEGQLREAQIEAALERVRSRSMAMHKSEELLDVISVVSEQLEQLEFKFIHVSFANNDRSQDYKFWTAYKGMSKPVRFTTPYLDIAMFNNMREAQKNSVSFYTDILTKKEHNEWHTHLLNHGGFEVFSKEENEFIMSRGMARSIAINTNIILILANYASIPYSDDDNKIIERFGKVFEQSYTRFLDLQKAEAQARESQIETALEKVRSRSLAMHKPDELKEVVIVIVEKLQELGVVLDANGVVLCTYFNDSKDVLHWIASPDFSFAGSYLLPYFDHPIFSDAWQSKENGDDYFSKAFTVEEKNSFFEYAFEHSDYRHFPDDFKEWIYKNDKHTLTFAWQKHSAILIPSHTGIVPNEAEREILQRFSKVFEQAYIRFMDLQKSEAQARESLIEIGLERVRSRTLAMQTSDELAETAVVLFKQLMDLGIAPNRLFIGIIKNNGTTIDAWATNEDGSKIASNFTLHASKNKSINKMLAGWKEKKKTFVIDMKGKELQDYFQYLNTEMNIPFMFGLEQKRRVQTIAYFSGGLIGMASPEDQPLETIKLLERFAAVFNLTYTRFNDLNVAEAQSKKAKEDLIHLQIAKKSAEDALAELQHTQKQLIQSEKMASLGELTAGIAHEIQNPLNFVNNFSEVSNELINEMSEEIEKGDLEEAKFLMADIKANLEKINHHGKRADAIVKGMLQHSRTSSAEKEPTYINKIADEYLRLAYHGLRAKDKSFNATLETNYDETIGQISVIPQDMGRVILNLITNAFYVVDEKKKSGIDQYEPTVSISTKKLKDKITISVKDNGNGIPKHVLDKIFQPFFTTKPTGQGTGLGLSMSYDIVTKAHNGELNVETKESEGTTFNIVLPI